MASLAESVRFHSPQARIVRRRGDLSVLAERAERQADARRAHARSSFGILRSRLAALDPTGVLARGYAIATHRGTGRAVRSVSEVAPGDGVDVRVADGAFGAVVEERKG